MDYKKIIKSRKTRVALLKLLNWIPDKPMLYIQYYVKFGRVLNLRNPKRFTEKLQWYKLYYRNPLMTQCAGKNQVREYVKSKGYEYILNEQYGVFSNVNEINFDKLPNQFVIKATVGAAGQQVLVCTDKSKLDLEAVKKRLSSWVSKHPERPHKNAGREWAYNNIKEELVVEKYINSSMCKHGLLSYKIFCFHGKAEFLYVIADIKDGFFDAGYGIYSTAFEKLPYNRVGETSLQLGEGKPENFEKMIEIAEQLSVGFPHVRVDLYNVNGKIIFGEMTFYNDSGYMKYDPDDFDYEVGKLFVLPEKSNE